MKFISLVVTAFITISTTNAQLARCNMDVLFPIVTGVEAARCARDSFFSYAMAITTGKPPVQQQYGRFCKSSACYRVFKTITAAVSTDCILENGSSLKQLADTVNDSCGALVPSQVQQTPGLPPAPTPAPTPAYDPALARCDNQAIVAILNSADSSECSNASGYNLIISAIAGKAPGPRNYDALCSNVACQKVIKKLNRSLPDNCTIKDGGSSIKSLFDILPATCK